MRTEDPRDAGELRETGELRVSVVICVYTEDRWEDILAAVDSVRGQSRPAYETLLVVDHNPELLRRLTERYADTGEVRVLANAGPRGLSAGRNTGIAAAGGDILAFLDDDAVAEQDWLRRLTGPYADPAVLAVGGRTLPVWASGRRPAWFPEEFDWVVGCYYRGLPPGRARVRNVLGGNASFRREAFELAGGFTTGIGRDGDTRPLGCEETELCIRLSAARPEAVLLLEDRAVIHHKVPAGREEFGYFRRRAYAEGISKALVTRSVGSRAGLETERRYTTRVLPAGVARGLRDALLGRPGGAGRAGAIAAGLAAAACGYAVGTVRRGALLPRPAGGPAGTEPRAAGPGPVSGTGGPGPRAGHGADGTAAGPLLSSPGGSGAGAGRPPGGPRRGRRPEGPGRWPGPPGPVPILMYHAVGETPAPAAYGLSVTPEALRTQLEVLAERGFTPVTTRALAAAWRSDGPLPPRPLLLTFDDGYEGVHRYALPALRSHGFTATVFATTGWLRGPHETPGALDLMLDWDQLRDLSAAGLEIGGHSHTHPQLDALTGPRLRSELARCRDLLAGELGRCPVSFAYPYGYSSRQVRAAVRAAGFRQSLAVGNALAERRHGPYALRRVTVRRSTGIEEFERLVEGRALGRVFARDRTLTKGYALVRRSRQALRKVTRAGD